MKTKTNIHYGGLAVGGLVGRAPPGCGADLRRKGQRSCRMRRDAERGAEAALTDNWSLELSGYWNPVQTASLSMNFHAVQLGGRYWFYESFVGHFLGQHLTYVGYDLGSRTKRYKGHACGLGVSYGYAWMLSKRWNVAVEAGVGLYRTKDTRRDPRSGTGTTSISTITAAGRSRRQS